MPSVILRSNSNIERENGKKNIEKNCIKDGVYSE